MPYLDANPKDRFSHDEAHIINTMKQVEESLMTVIFFCLDKLDIQYITYNI